MSPGVSICVHLWRGFGGDIQRDLFFWRYRLGILTLTVERKDPLTAYRGIRQAAECAISALNRRVRRDEDTGR